MLRAALIGLPSSGKTTLFQLMTSIHDAPRGKGDVNIGISKVPDERLDTLTAMYNPRKRVPATVEFTDIVGAGAQRRPGARRCGRLQERGRARPRHTRVPRPSVAHPSGSIDPARDAQAMEDELILADLGVAERRLERIEKDLKKGKSAELDKERDLVQRCKEALEHGTPLRALQLAGDDLKRLRGFQFLSAKPLLLVINLDESDVAEVGADIASRRRKDRARRPFSRTRRRARSRSVREDRAGDLAARSRRCQGVPRRTSVSPSRDSTA